MSGLVRPLAAVVLVLLSATTQSRAQKLNPNISVIGDTRATWNDTTEDVEIGLDEVEVAFVGPLNPYASAEVYVGFHGAETVEIEEAKLLLDRYLPGGFGLTIGRFLQDFGQLNQLHSHAYPFVERPLMHAEFFGEDGVVDEAVRLDWIAPAEEVTLRASAGAVRGDLFLGGHHHEEEPSTEEEEEAPELGVTGRLDLFAQPTEAFSFLLGGSVLHGEHDTHDAAMATWICADAKARWDLGPYRALVLNAEGVFGSLEETDEAAESDPSGFFVSADVRANRRWNLGGFVESATERADDEIRTNRYGGFIGLGLMEETTMFRLVGHVTEPDEGSSEVGVIAQALFGLGPHKPHRY
ncbi:MAG: hypothetical protein ACT4PE_11410 [Candidatus Eiseniibacteriota bacterium]